MHPKKTLAQLHDTPEDGTFVVYATFNGFVDGEDCWYPACKCHRSVAPDSEAYYCKGCVKNVFQMVPRYRVKINVSDATSVAVFVMFAGDVQNILNLSCSSLVSASKVCSCLLWLLLCIFPYRLLQLPVYYFSVF
ncbi:uncharacterized protein [Medicago truncatula]|uniref:uncharacterized protein n=1 Tax=Medicago truncatula TaxID=3880 RepID=UPI001966E9F0|nr:uncharacterized protein LOC120579930 [Medicago truncatula]